MPKIDLVIPKGTKCKNGVCEQDIEIENLEIPEILPTVKRIPEIQIKQNEKAPAPQTEKTEVKTIETIQKVVPSWQPSFICKGPVAIQRRTRTTRKDLKENVSNVANIRKRLLELVFGVNLTK